MSVAEFSREVISGSAAVLNIVLEASRSSQSLGDYRFTHAAEPGFLSHPAQGRSSLL